MARQNAYDLLIKLLLIGFQFCLSVFSDSFQVIVGLGRAKFSVDFRMTLSPSRQSGIFVFSAVILLSVSDLGLISKSKPLIWMANVSNFRYGTHAGKNGFGLSPPIIIAVLFNDSCPVSDELWPIGRRNGHSARLRRV